MNLFVLFLIIYFAGTLITYSICKKMLEEHPEFFNVPAELNGEVLCLACGLIWPLLILLYFALPRRDDDL
jgi:uncharacterized BrkB/YihY/UPF0761 family membrane protein